jgi:hypothetical protein
MTKHKKIAEKKAPAAPNKVVAKAKPISKLGQLEGMLRRAEGATIPQLVKALDWQACLHSVGVHQEPPLDHRAPEKMPPNRARRPE